MVQMPRAPVVLGEASALEAAARHAAHDGLAGKEEEEDHRQHHDRGGRHQKFRAGTGSVVNTCKPQGSVRLFVEEMTYIGT